MIKMNKNKLIIAPNPISIYVSLNLIIVMGSLVVFILSFSGCSVYFLVVNWNWLEVCNVPEMNDIVTNLQRKFYDFTWPIQCNKTILNSLFFVGLSEINKVSVIEGTSNVMFLDEQQDLVEFPTMKRIDHFFLLEHET